MRNQRTRERGQTIILYALGMTTVFGMVGMVSDMGYVYYRKQSAQAAAQSAAMAAVKAAFNSSGGTFVCGSHNVSCTTYTCPPTITGYGSDNFQVGCLYASKNGYKGSQVWLEGNIGSVDGVRATYWVAAHASDKLPLLFSAVLGNSSSIVTARSTVAYIPATGGGCIYALDNNPADSGTLTVNGSASITSGCGVWVDGPNANAANLNGGGTITVAGGQTTQIVGGFTCAGGAIGCITPAPTTGAPSSGDPLSGLPAPVDPGTCTTPTWTNGHNGTISNPTGGVVDICGDLSLNNGDNFNFPPGTYIFKSCNPSGNQGFSVQGSAQVQGTGVFFYFTGTCSPQVTGGALIHLTAPTTGTYSGILMYQDPNDTAGATLAGHAAQRLDGIVYFPTQILTYAGGSNQAGQSQALSIVAWEITVTGLSYIQNAANSPYLGTFSGFAVVE